jgi:hypothetical protein
MIRLCVCVCVIMNEVMMNEVIMNEVMMNEVIMNEVMMISYYYISIPLLTNNVIILIDIVTPCPSIRTA